jgi:hypothetical protein
VGGDGLLRTRRAEPSVDVDCEQCGATFRLAKRNLRRHREQNIPHRCLACRHPASVNGPSAAAVAKARKWWLARFSLDELRSWPLT